MKQVCILIVLTGLSWSVHAQISLSGRVKGTGDEFLIGAHVILNNGFNKTVTDANGSFVIKGLRPGNYRISVSYIGYQQFDEALHLRRDTSLSILLKESAVISDAVIISGVRASQNTPTTFSTLEKEEIERKNTAQDLPYLLNNEPSVVVTSDAGNGTGYTGLRIRGSDITRINVTINGIPLNDPESHAVYWVDIPDFAGSVNSMQVQRGVGSSTNGAGAFGASMNIETSTFSPKPYGLLNLAAGSFGTWKTSFQAGTGIIDDHWYFEGRSSALGSDGYIDRASSKLSSFFVQGGYYDSKTLIKAILFGGKEKTYQAWYGIDRYTLKEDRRFNWAGAIFNDNGTISYYDNQTDNYRQDHYQLHISRILTTNLSLSVSGHFTRGSGYYEEYRQDDSFEDYGLDNIFLGKDSVLNTGVVEYFYHDTIKLSDMIRRRWLDNYFYGITWSLKYRGDKTDLILGGALNKYDQARHYGEVIWSEFSYGIPRNHDYYDNVAAKNDFNLFAKMAWTPAERLTLYGDLQYRTINYSVNGIESHLNPLSIKESFHFFNPKAGLSYSLKLGTLYASYGIAHREPIRDDFTDALAGEKPKPEILGNLEMGIRKSDESFHYQLNYFLMNYRDQLVLTGAINDDGQYIRKNAGKSYRYGIEMAAGYVPLKFAELAGTISLSRNRTDYRQQDDEGQVTEFNNTPISFSPSVIGSLSARLIPFRGLDIEWITKYVGKQFLDNTGNDDLALNPYCISDTRLSYTADVEKFPSVEFSFMINNLFDKEYESNGFVYDTEPYYYPQAGINLLASIKLRF